MNYFIENKGKRIAAFVEKTDRDVCLEAFRDYWGGSDFEATDRPETEGD